MESQSRRPVRLGFLGCGRVTTTLHLPALRRVPEISVAAVADQDGDRAAAVRRTWNIGGTHPTLPALLADESLDAIAVCTPPAQHADAACAVLASGKALFLEKPLAPSLADCDRILAAAAGATAPAVVGFNLRQHALLLEGRSLIRRGALGEIEAIRSSFTTDIRLTTPLPAWRDRRQEGGGALQEIGTHHFDLWRWLLGAEIMEVSATGQDAAAADILASVTARLTTGALATGFFAERTYPSNQVEILGTEGRLRISLYDFDGLGFTPRSTAPGSVADRLARVRRTVAALPTGIASALRGGQYLATFATAWRQFALTAHRQAEPAATLADGRAAALIGLAAIESARSGATVSVAR